MVFVIKFMLVHFVKDYCHQHSMPLKIEYDCSVLLDSSIGIVLHGVCFMLSLIVVASTFGSRFYMIVHAHGCSGSWGSRLLLFSSIQ